MMKSSIGHRKDDRFEYSSGFKRQLHPERKYVIILTESSLVA